MDSYAQEIMGVRAEWQKKMPDVPPPPDRSLSSYLAAFGTEAVFQAIDATGRKARWAKMNGQPAAKNIYGYFVATVRRASQEEAR